MTSYPAVRKTAHHAPVLAELEFAMHTLAAFAQAILLAGTAAVLAAQSHRNTSLNLSCPWRIADHAATGVWKSP